MDGQVRMYDTSHWVKISNIKIKVCKKHEEWFFNFIRDVNKSLNGLVKNLESFS